MASFHLLAEYFDSETFKSYWREMVALAREPYFLPSIVVCVVVAVLITYFQDKQSLAHGAAMEDSEDALDADDSFAVSAATTKKDADEKKGSAEDKPVKKAFALPSTPLPPPKNDVYTAEDLKQYDGSQPDKPIYVAIKGTIFDVSAKPQMYGPGAGYHVFAGKDASKALGKSSLKPEDCVADYSGLDEKEMKTLDDWVIFFEKRYPIVGKVAN